MNLIALITIPVLVAWDAVVVRTLWVWFVVPLGLPALSLAHAGGISMLVGILSHQYQDYDTPESDRGRDLARRIADGLIRPLLALGIGRILKMAMA